MPKYLKKEILPFGFFRFSSSRNVELLSLLMTVIYCVGVRVITNDIIEPLYGKKYNL